MTVLIKTSQGRSKAVNLSNRSWETFPVEGDDTKVKMTLDNGDEFIMKASSYEELLSGLVSSDGFLTIE